jgi:hypothetical protein
VSVTLYESGIRAIEQQALAVSAEAVRLQAFHNADNDVIGILTSRLIEGIYSRVEAGQAVVGTTARNDQGFAYPTYWDLNGKPWLFEALRSVFPDAQRT